MKPYSIPLISSDLRHEEMILQMCDALEYLDRVADDIFNRIGHRVGENHERLCQINGRILVAEAKIKRIKGSNKATRVFSSSKYPLPEREPDYQTVFADVPVSMNRLTSAVYNVHSKLQLPDELSMNEKRKFYSFKGQQAQSAVSSDIGKQSEGLGGLPQSITSISSLLLFNTSENPYKKYVMFDPLGVVTKTRTSIDDHADGGLAAAPSTIQQREEQLRKDVPNFMYSPGMGDVPIMSLPDFLPDLPGVADDLMYSAELGPSIAPSVSGPTVAIPDLPAVVPDLEMTSLAANSQPPVPYLPGTAGPGQSIGPSLSSGAPPPFIAPPPPPPPPPPPAQPIQQAPVPSAAQVLPSVTLSQTTSAPTPPATALPSTDTGRANLLASICGFDKKKLQRADDRKVARRKKKDGVSGEAVAGAGKADSGGGDLMSDLAAKLQMRRKGILGAGKAIGQQTGAASSDDGNPDAGDRKRMTRNPLENVAKLIPPPQPKLSAAESGDFRDEDWA